MIATAAIGGEPKTKPPYYYATVIVADRCSGVIVKKGESVSVGLSAHHCTANIGDEFSFVNTDGTTGQARWVAKDLDSDLAMFKCWSKDITGVAVPIKRGNKRGPKYDGWGYSGLKGPMWKELDYKGTVIIEGLSGLRYEFKVDDGKFSTGDSGSGVYSNGKLIGITSHGSKGHKYLYSCTSLQLTRFLEKNSDKMRAELVKWDESKAPPLNSDRDRTVALREVIRQLQEIKAENERLRELVRKIANTPITVQILDPKTKKVLSERAYPFGTPIKLLLPER
jgi:hypothetical protein